MEIEKIMGFGLFAAILLIVSSIWSCGVLDRTLTHRETMAGWNVPKAKLTP